jgi:site-specific recombinase XerD
VAAAENLEVAKLLLGHSDIATTLRYVNVHQDRGVEAALRLG